jgi:hypothetical protein
VYHVKSVSRTVPHLCGLPRLRRSKRLLMALRAFFDESGTDPKGPGFVMGGFLSTADEWDRAADAWDACLRESPSIKAFHHVDTEKSSGEFYGWRPEDVQAKVLRLAQTIASFNLQGFATAISHSWFSPRNKRAAKGMFGSRIYDHAFLKIVSGVTHHVTNSISGDDKVDFIFERRPELKSCISNYKDLFDLWPDRMGRAGSCVPSDDETNVALQMADLLSWEFLQITDRNEQSAAFLCINNVRPVYYLPCTPPKWFPYALALHAYGQSVKDDSDSLRKRICGDHEKSLEVVEATRDLVSNKLDFDAHFKTLCLITDSPEYFVEYVKESKRAEEQIRDRNSKPE